MAISNYSVPSTEAMNHAIDSITRIVETWSSGASWYRVYSDGWCEQGGYMEKTWSSSTHDGLTITFLKPFIDTNYTFSKSTSITSRSATGAYSAGNTYASGTKLTYQISVGTESYGDGVLWRASGYIS